MVVYFHTVIVAAVCSVFTVTYPLSTWIYFQLMREHCSEHVMQRLFRTDDHKFTDK